MNSKNLKRLIHIAFLCALTYFVFTFGKQIDESYILSLYDKIITIASIIFAVMGAWLSIAKMDIKYDVETSIKNSDKQKGDDALIRAKNIVYPMTASSLIIASSLIFYALFYTYQVLNLHPSLIIVLKGVSIWLVLALYYYLMINLIPMFTLGSNFIIEILELKRKAQKDKHQPKVIGEND